MTRRWWIIALALYFGTVGTAYYAAQEHIGEVKETAELNIAEAVSGRIEAEARAQKYQLDYNALLVDYTDMCGANEQLAALLRETREELAALQVAQNPPAWQNAGEFRIYHYCPCRLCCGKDDGITATGTLAGPGRTVAVDPSVIPLGSEVLINGKIYIAEDTGVKGKAIDIFVNDHAQANQMGTYLTQVSWR